MAAAKPVVSVDSCNLTGRTKQQFSAMAFIILVALDYGQAMPAMSGWE